MRRLSASTSPRRAASTRSSSGWRRVALPSFSSPTRSPRCFTTRIASCSCARDASPASTCRTRPRKRNCVERSMLERILFHRERPEPYLFAVILLLVALLAATTDSFFTLQNLFDLLVIYSFIGILAA